MQAALGCGRRIVVRDMPSSVSPCIHSVLNVSRDCIANAWVASTSTRRTHLCATAMTWTQCHRSVVPTSGTTAPVGWVCLPVFETGVPYVASGHYHLPLLHGVPHGYVLKEMANVGDPDAVILQMLKVTCVKNLLAATGMQPNVSPFSSPEI